MVMSKGAKGVKWCCVGGSRESTGTFDRSRRTDGGSKIGPGRPKRNIYMSLTIQVLFYVSLSSFQDMGRNKDLTDVLRKFQLHLYNSVF